MKTIIFIFAAAAIAASTGCTSFMRYRAIDNHRNRQCVLWCDKAAGRLTNGICEPDGTCVCDTGELIFRRPSLCHPMMLAKTTP